MSTTVDSIPTDSSVQTNIFNAGFSPLLVAVGAGSYASNSSFGASATIVANYSANQITDGTNFSFPQGAGTKTITAKTRVEYRVNQKICKFRAEISFDQSTTAPSGIVTNDELRIINANAPPSSVQPARYAGFLPEPDRSQPLPLFSNVRIENINPAAAGNWQPIFPGTAFRILQARLLDTATIALLSTDMIAYPPTSAALSASDFNTLLGQVNARFLRIVIEGDYRTA